MANVGTTMRGAVDDIPRIRDILREQTVTNHYIHADAALSGMILPFVKNPQPYGFDAGVDSISVSGHKLIGAPLPCGVVLTRRRMWSGADRYDRALYVLNKAGFKAVSDDALVLRLPDEPGALAVVADSLKEVGVNIESLHIVSRGAGHAMIALKTDNRTEAIAAIGIENIV